jgi:hypothetical protein
MRCNRAQFQMNSSLREMLRSHAAAKSRKFVTKPVNSGEICEAQATDLHVSA